MGKMQRDKGARNERAFANDCKPVFPDAKRGLKQTRDAGEESDITGVDDYWCEAKAHKKVNIQAAMRQALEVCGDKKPIVFSKDDRGPKMVTMLLKDWLSLETDRKALASVVHRVSGQEEERFHDLGLLGDGEAAA